MFTGPQGATRTHTLLPYTTLFLAVVDVGGALKRGLCLGLVGECGCGKTTRSKMLLRALRPDSGSITFTDYTSAGDKEGPVEEIDVLALGGDALMECRKKIKFVLQDPFSSLNPRDGKSVV